MTDTSHGTGGLTFDKSKRSWPNEMNILLALIIIIVIFEVLGQVLPGLNGQSFLFDTQGRFDTIFNEARLQIIILQVAIIGIIALGVTQVIITAGIDLSSGPLVAATAMIAMSFAQTELVNGNPNPKAIFGTWAMDLPVLVPVVVGLLFGALIGGINGTFVAYFRIPPFIATLGMFLICRGIALWWSAGRPVSFPTESYKSIGSGMMPVVWFLSLAVVFHVILRYTVYGKHTYAIGSNEEAARMSGINVRRHKVMVYMIASMLAAFAGVVLSSKASTAQAGMGEFYELFAITMAVIGGISLTGGRGSIIGTVLGAMVLGVIRSGFTFVKLDGSYQLMAMGGIIIAAVILDQYRQHRAAAKA
jgi:inositol transport system permease protein